MSVYVGIDVHRKRSQVAVIDQDGGVLANRNVPAALEAAFGWGWLVELLEDYEFAPHLVHPLRCTAIASAWLKNDKGRCGDLGLVAARGPAAGGVDRAAAGAPAASAAAAPGPVGAVADAAAQPDPRRARRPRPGPAGRALERPGRARLATLELPAVSREVIEDDLALIDALQPVIDRLDWQARQRARSDPRVKILAQLPGVGSFTGLVILAEIGEVSRFASMRKLAFWAGLTPTVHGSDRTVRHGHIPGQGSVWLRWAAVAPVAGHRREQETHGRRHPGQTGRLHRPGRLAENRKDPGTYALFQGKQWTTRLEIGFAALFAALLAGVLVLLIAITLILLRLGFLLLVAGPFFLIVGTHPGFGRVIALRWGELLIGVLLKSAAIAIVLSVLLYAYSLIMGTSDAVEPGIVAAIKASIEYVKQRMSMHSGNALLYA